MVAGQAIQEFEGYLESNRRSKTIKLIAHNMPGLDGPILQRLLSRSYLDDTVFLDTLRPAQHWYPDVSSHAYRNLLRYFKLPDQSGFYSDALDYAQGLKAIVNEICRNKSISIDTFLYD